MKTVFRRTISQIGHNKQPIRVIFGAIYLAKPGLTAGGRQVSDKILVYHVYQKRLRKLKLFYYPLCFTKARYRYSYIDGFRVIYLGEIYCKVVF